MKQMLMVYCNKFYDCYSLFNGLCAFQAVFHYIGKPDPEFKIGLELTEKFLSLFHE